MFALDLFNNDHERRLAEGAVDQLEQRRIDDLAMKMDDLVARAKTADTPAVKAALMKEFQKCKAERDSYFKIKDECMGYGTLTGEGQVTPTATGLKHHANPGNYGGYEPEPELKGLNKTLTKNLEKGMGVEFKRAKKFGGGIEIDETGIPGNVPANKIPGKADLLKGKGRQTYEAQDRKKNSEEVNESQRLHQGDPIVVTGPNEFEGKTGEIEDFSPSGTFVVVNLYNHGRHSMHLSDIAYNEYADQEQDEEDDWYDEDEIDEGFQDFNKVEPYEVCLAGKPVKQFDYYEDARRFHDNWKKKLYREGNKEKADKITLNPIMKEEEQKPGFGEFPPKQEITIVPPKKLKSGETYQDRNKYWQSQGQAPIYKTNEEEGRVDPILIKALKRMPDGLATHHQVLDAAYDAYAMEKGYLAMKGNHGVTDVYIPKLMGLYKDKHGLTFNEEYTPAPAKPFRNPPGFNKQGTGVGNRFADLNRAELANIQPSKGTPVPAKAFAQGIEKDLQKAMTKPTIQVKKNKGVAEVKADPAGSWIVYGGSKIMKFKTHGGAKAYAEKNGGKVASSEFYADKIQGIKEAETDYSKRRQRERDVDAGKPVPKQREPRMTDYQKRRAEQKRQEQLGEDQDTSGVESAIIRRIMVAHTDLLKQFGPEKVMQAVEEVAYNVGDVDEIGTSDVSAWVNEVKRILGAE